MKRVLFIFFVIATVAPIQKSWAQENNISIEGLAQLEATEDSLGLLSYAIVNDSLEENRFFAVSAFIPMLVKALKVPNSFHFPFTQVKTVSIQYAADSTFRVFTWQLYVDKDTYKYYGAIQMNTPELKLFPLVDRSDNITGDIEQAVSSNKEWYGAVYYKIKTVKTDEQTHHLLFGFDGYTFFKKRKIVDVLTFQDGKPVFGAPVFVNTEKQSKNRLLLEYSAAASMRCNYDESLEILIFDHLTQVGGEYGEGDTNIPDGTYEGYELVDGKWHYNKKIFDQILDEAPRPEPVLDNRGKNIFGGQ